MHEYTLLLSHSGTTPVTGIRADSLRDAIDKAEAANPGRYVIWGRQSDAVSPPKQPIESLWGGHR